MILLQLLKCLQSQDKKSFHVSIISHKAKCDSHSLFHSVSFQLSLQLAMFKTYTTPKNSKILVATGEFGKECPRRYEDTELILREFADVYGRIQNHIKDHPDTPEEHLLDQWDRKKKAIKRLNELHGKYNIGNDDFLYTLTMFITEPVAWVNKYEWRQLDEREINVKIALFTSLPKFTYVLYKHVTVLGTSLVLR